MTVSVAGTPQAFGFADGGSGHVCTNADGAPAADQWDVLFANSDTLVSTPPGFTAEVSAVANQGAYVFARKAVGGETASVTVTTSGNFNCHVIWVRLTGANLADVTGSAQTNGAAGGTSTPAFTSGALAAEEEIALAFAALHSLNGPALPTSPVWSAGYTPAGSGFQGGVAASGAGGFVAYKTPAGTAAESPSVSFTNGASDRYLLFVTLTAAPTGPVPDVNATSTAALTAGRTSTTATTATYTSTAALAAGRTSTAAVSEG